MAESTPSFFARLFMAFAVFWRIIIDPVFAGAVRRLRRGEQAGAAEDVAEAPRPRLAEAEPNAALQLLGLLQQEGRFIDFLQEDVAAYSDAEVGAAARVVHEGCRKTLTEHLSIEPVRSEAEGTRVTLEAGFDSSAVRLTGKVVGEAPFTGSLTHRGWRVADPLRAVLRGSRKQRGRGDRSGSDAGPPADQPRLRGRAPPVALIPVSAAPGRVRSHGPGATLG